MQKLTHEQIVWRQSQGRVKRVPLVVLLNDIRSLHNVGSIFRTADGAGVEKIWLCGITGYPPDSQIAKTALGAQDHVPWEYASQAGQVLADLRKRHYQIVVLEQTDQSLDYAEFIPQGPTCLVVGNEIEGVAASLLDFCDKAIEIEMAGHKNSLNVAVAFGIVVYHIHSHLKKISG